MKFTIWMIMQWNNNMKITQQMNNLSNNNGVRKKEKELKRKRSSIKQENSYHKGFPGHQVSNSMMKMKKKLDTKLFEESSK